MIIGESNPHDINTRHCSLPGLAGAVEDQDGMEEGSNQTTGEFQLLQFEGYLKILLFWIAAPGS